MELINDLKQKYYTLDAFGKIIAINAVLFVFSILLRAFKLNAIINYFTLPSNFWEFLWQPWALVTYGFLHSGIWHILFNMLLLLYLSRVATNLLREKMILNVFFLGIIFGGVAYLSIANLWPNSHFIPQNGMLLGASAGVSALLAFVAIYIPYATIRLFNTFTIKWQHIALFFVLLDFIRLVSGVNQGGYISHFGGYLLGYYYAYQLQKGKDIGTGFERLMDRFVNLFKPKSTLKTVHRKPSKTRTSKKTTTKSTSETLTKQKQIDAILDKISKSGYDSLTAEEKAFLFKAGKD